MTGEKVKEVAEQYTRYMRNSGWEPHRFPADRVVGAMSDSLNHTTWMLEEIPKMVDAGKLEKSMRWLGFVQGVLWGWGVLSIERFKKDNAPAEEELVDV